MLCAPRQILIINRLRQVLSVMHIKIRVVQCGYRRVKMRQWIHLDDFSNYAHSAIFDLPIKPNDIDDGGSVEEFELETRHKIHFILRQHMGLSEKDVQSFMRAHDSAWHRSPIDNDIAQDLPQQNSRKLQSWHCTAVKGLSESQLDLLTQQLGVVNFDRYYPDDLATLLSILGEQGTIEHLKKGDVTVIFADAFGGPNGALQRVN